MTQALMVRKPEAGGRRRLAAAGSPPQEPKAGLRQVAPGAASGALDYAGPDEQDSARRELDGGPAPRDAFIVDRNLRSWASSRVLSRGVDCYRKGRVLSLESCEDAWLKETPEESAWGGSAARLLASGERRIVARVEGTAEEPYEVEIRFSPQGLPISKCACPFDWEPLCKHAVAALLAWQQKETGSEPILARDLPDDIRGQDADEKEKYLEELAAIERELRRASSLEQGIRIAAGPAGPLGAYSVRSGNPNRGGLSYRVTVRDADFEHASCECLDFRTNELGTCKHLECVRRRLSTKPRARELMLAARRSRLVSAYLGTRDSRLRSYSTAEQIRLHIPDAARSRMPAWLDEHVDSQGWLLADGDPTEIGRAPALRRTRAQRLLERLGSLPGIDLAVEPRIGELLRGEEEQLRWEQRIAELAKAPASSRSWADSVGRMKVRLHPYQVEGILFAAAKRRAFLADDMGLGKTAQAIGAALLLKELGAARRVLVITPASLKFQWKAEIEKVSDETADIIAGDAKSRDEQYKKGRAFFTLVNYELLYRDLDQLLSFKPDLVILDEAQRIKNWETKIAQTIKRLKSPLRLVLTGTPLENRLPELLSISEFLEPRALGAPWKLVPSYAELDEEDRIIGYSRLDHLRGRMSKFLLRRSRAEVLSQLPQRTDNHYWTPITPAQADVHKELGLQVIRILNKLKKFKRLTREDVKRMMMLLTVMRIVCNAYGQYDWKALEHEVLTARRASPALKRKIGSPKLEEFYKVMAELMDAPGQKVVVFSQWERMLRLAELYIRDILEGAGARSVMFSGALSMKKRAEEVRRFLEDPSTRVFFSTDAGGVGLNLQQGANIVVNLDVPWNPAVLEQRVGRVHRMGQKKSVQAVHFVSSECVEERIFALVAQKKALFSGIFSGDAAEVRFTRDQMSSFVEKMKLIVAQEDGAPAQAQDESADAVAEEPQAEDSPAFLEAAGDRVAEAAPGASNGPGASPGVEVDLSPVIKALSALITPGAQAAGNIVPAARAQGSGAQAGPNGRPAQAPAVSLRVKRDAQGIHLTLPDSAAELLRGLGPLAAALAKLAGGA